MANTITITQVDFANTANPSQVFTFEYKLATDTAWSMGSNNKSVDGSGVLASPLVIPGLTPGALYYVRASNNCNSPREYYIQQVQL